MKKFFLNLIQHFLISVFNARLVKNPPKDAPVDCYITINSLLKHYSPRVVCDIGAHNGTWISTLHQYCSTVNSIVLIEPQQKYIQDLKKLNLGNAAVRILQYGVSNQSDTLQIKGGNSCASFLDFDHTYDGVFTGSLEEQHETVMVEPLDVIYAQNNLPQPDLVKIDVQGLELEVLEGGSQVISNAKVVIVELSTLPFYEKQQPLSSLIRKLEAMNFILVDIGYIWREEYDQNKPILQLDGIFMKK